VIGGELDQTGSVTIALFNYSAGALSKSHNHVGCIEQFIGG
jgi:hypothetical protein